MKHLFTITSVCLLTLSCANPQSEFYWKPAADLKSKIEQKKNGGEKAQPVETAVEEAPTEQPAEAPAPVEIVPVKEEEPQKADIEEVKKTESGSTVCMLNDVLSNDFEVINPGTKGVIEHSNGKTYFVAGGKRYDITNVPAPTKPC